MAVIPEAGDQLNLDLLRTFKVEREDNKVLLLKPPQPLEVVVDGRNTKGIVYLTEEEKPEEFVPDWEAGDFD
jgi:hypothetical protein